MPAVPTDGQITSLTTLAGPLTGGEVMEIVSPGNAAQGNSYQITLNVLATFFSVTSATTEVITAGATFSSPYLILTTDGKILFNKTVGAPSYTQAPLAASMLITSAILIKDLKGDAATNNITVVFTSGELCDGLSQVVISNNYGWVRVNPTPGGGSWFQS
jgi:hypothetical protein